MSSSVDLAVTMMIGTAEPGPDRPADVDAGQPREHHVEEHEVGPVGFEPLERLYPVARHGDRETLPLEVHRQRVHEGLRVLDDEHPRRRSGAIVLGGPGCRPRSLWESALAAVPALDGARGSHLPAVRLRSLRERAGTSALVVGHRSVLCWRGRLRVNVEPSPSRDSTWTLPRWFAATCRTIASPRPVPPVERLRPASTR